jgi:acyl carrier protein
MNTEKRVIGCIAKVLNQPVCSDSAFASFKGFDSLDQLEIIMQLEDEFKCRINEDELPPFTTVQQVIDYMRDNHIQAAA